MTYVRGHRRSDGTYVRSHYRRTRPSTARRTTRPTAAPRRASMAATRPQPAAASQTVWVRRYRRADGTVVRGHHRQISGPVVAAAGGGGVLLLILLLLALINGAGSGSASTPSHHPTAPASISGHLPTR